VLCVVCRFDTRASLSLRCHVFSSLSVNAIFLSPSPGVNAVRLLFCVVMIDVVVDRMVDEINK